MVNSVSCLHFLPQKNPPPSPSQPRRRESPPSRTQPRLDLRPPPAQSPIQKRATQRQKDEDCQTVANTREEKPPFDRSCLLRLAVGSITSEMSRFSSKEALDQLAIAIRKQGASTAGEAWNMLQDNSSNPKPLTAFQLKSKVKSLFGVEISEYQAQRLVTQSDQDRDGKLGSESWTHMLGPRLREAANHRGATPRRDSPLLSAPSPRNAVHRKHGSDSPRVSSQATPRGSAKDNALPNEVEAFLEEELKGVVGLEMVKQQLRQMIKNIRVEERRREMGLKSSSDECDAYDMVFYGNPGTGKTSIARLIPTLLQKMRILKPKAPFLEVGRHDLVGAYIGATEANTVKKIGEAKGGVMFVDEAYTLTSGEGKDFGVKALETIMQCMTSNEKDRPIFIFAGYKVQMESFLGANPGMARRVAYKFNFEDYSPQQLTTIAIAKASKRGLKFSPAAVAALPRVFGTCFTAAARSMWNGGLASRVVTDCIQALNGRLDPCTATREELSTLQEEDVEAGSVMSAQAVSALQAVVDDGGDLGDGNETDDRKGRSARGETLNTMHLKQHWPSALRRIAALEQELCGQRPADAPPQQCTPPCDGEDGADLWGMLGEALRECGRGVELRDAELVETTLRAALSLIRRGNGRGDGEQDESDGGYDPLIPEMRPVLSSGAPAHPQAPPGVPCHAPPTLPTVIAGESPTSSSGSGKGVEEEEQGLRGGVGVVVVGGKPTIVAGPLHKGREGEVPHGDRKTPLNGLLARAGDREVAKPKVGARGGHGNGGTPPKPSSARRSSPTENLASPSAGRASPIARKASPSGGSASPSECSGGRASTPRKGKWVVGDAIPGAWREGAEYSRGVSGCHFGVSEIVVVVRSDGRCTFGQVITLAPQGGDKGAMSVLVGAGLQKTVAAEKVGKIGEETARSRYNV